MKKIIASISVLALVVCLALPIMFFRGSVGEFELKTGFLAASAVWFVGATVWARKRKT